MFQRKIWKNRGSSSIIISIALSITLIDLEMLTYNMILGVKLCPKHGFFSNEKTGSLRNVFVINCSVRNESSRQLPHPFSSSPQPSILLKDTER